MNHPAVPFIWLIILPVAAAVFLIRQHAPRGSV